MGKAPARIALALSLCTFGFVAALILTSVRSGAAGMTVAPRSTTPLEVQPDVEARPGPPHAGKTFTGIDVWIPLAPSFRIQKLICQASVGGYFEGDPGYQVFTGGVPIRPILRRYYVRLPSGRRPLRRITCGWRLRKSSRGKLLSLQSLDCHEDCGEGGLTIDWQYQGLNRATSFYALTWRVRR